MKPSASTFSAIGMRQRNDMFRIRRETGVELKTTYRTGKTVFVKAGRTEKEKYGHPTAKPEDIIETLIANSCPAGGGRA